MTSSAECASIPERAIAYLERTVSPVERQTIDNHLRQCQECRDAVQQVRAVFAALEYIQLEAPSATESLTEPQPASGTEHWKSRLASAPWWLVSGSLHILLIALAGLISIAIEIPHHDDAVIMMTELQPKNTAAKEQEQSNADPVDILAQDKTAATDSNSNTSSDVEVPPDLLTKAVVGDHFETIDPEAAGTHSALGDVESRSFHSVSGNADRPGGGGSGGMSMDDIVGIGGAGSRGTGAGFGSGDGLGVGVGTGSGKGSFGQRNGGGRKLMVRKHGGSAATESAVEKALEWLAYHQDADGHWEIGKYEGYEPMSCGVTGIAVLAFLGAGHTERVGRYRENVKRGLAWIISKQGPDGSIGEGFKENTADFGHLGHAYHHAICSLTLAEAAGMAHQKATVEAAQRAVDYSIKHQGGEGSDRTAWRYLPKTDADASVSGWFVMQLKSARIAGLHVDPASLEGALKFYDSVEDKREVNGYSGGRFRYTKSEGVQLNPSAIGILCNLFLGRQPNEMTGGAELLSQNLPKWDKELGDGVEHLKFPMYYTYYGTLTMFQMGGDYWKKWNTAMKAMLLPQQRKDGDSAGSWDPPGGWDDHCGGRVYTTAMAALCLEVYYRYAKLQ